MTDNEIISAWRGECRHPNKHYREERIGQKYATITACSDCEVYSVDEGRVRAKDYDSDPAAWDEGLWDEIGKTGLWRKFIQNHGELTCNKETMAEYASKEVDMMEFLDRGGFLMVRSTPAQKARALAKAIEESK